jgi:hypothetical protein
MQAWSGRAKVPGANDSAARLMFVILAAAGSVFAIASARADGTSLAPQDTIPFGQGKFTLYRCIVNGDKIVCQSSYLKTADGSIDIVYDPKTYPWNSKFVDEFKVDHPQVNGYFINGLGVPVSKVNLGKDEQICIQQEFDSGGETPEQMQKIKSFRVVGLNGTYTLRGDVGKRP